VWFSPIRGLQTIPGGLEPHLRPEDLPLTE
jgi:hypothetical protein